jgi:hypothetical protein
MPVIRARHFFQPEHICIGQRYFAASRWGGSAA